MDRIITINSRFDLCYDDLGDKWIVEKKITKTGKEARTNYCGYHWHFEHLLNAFCKKRLPEKDAKTVKGALKALTETEQEIQRIAEEIGKVLDGKWEENTKEYA